MPHAASWPLDRVWLFRKKQCTGLFSVEQSYSSDHGHVNDRVDQIVPIQPLIWALHSDEPGICGSAILAGVGLT